MNEPDAEAALLALGDPLEWQWTKYERGGGHWQAEYRDMIYRVATSDSEHAQRRPWNLTFGRAWMFAPGTTAYVSDLGWSVACQTGTEAKAACAYHALTGKWSLVLQLKRAAHEEAKAARQLSD